MEGLTFGEQVKIILSRRSMTIKELAELIQERTGKPMSRQNLTQRLGRDNFQEKDMRMIAAILDCPFQLSIFPAEQTAEEEKIMEYANASTQKRHKVLNPEVRELTGDERDMTIGELYEIHEELKELEEASAEAVIKEQPEETVLEAEEAESVEVEEEAVSVEEEAVSVEEEVEETLSVETPEHVEYTTENEEAAAPIEKSVEEAAVSAAEEVEVLEPVEEDVTVEEPQPEVKSAEEKKERFHTGGIFLRRKRRGDDKKVEEKAEEEPKEEKKPARVITPDSADFEPVLKHKDAEEDLNVGEMNPYTGREYQTNSVRMHPSRIGYVQVYDRSLHQWTDMTEWAFLGYQERKKALLGKDYEPPIYLD